MNLFFFWILLGIEKNLQIEIWSIKYFPNLQEVSLKPEEFDLDSELSRILSVDIVDAHRIIKSQFNDILWPFSRFTMIIFVASSVILSVSNDSTRWLESIWTFPVLMAFLKVVPTLEDLGHWSSLTEELRSNPLDWING